MNKNVSVWRGILPPPTRTHVWLKEDGNLYHHVENKWRKIFTEATEEESGLMSKSDKLILNLLNKNLHWS